MSQLQPHPTRHIAITVHFNHPYHCFWQKGGKVTVVYLGCHGYSDYTCSRTCLTMVTTVSKIALVALTIIVAFVAMLTKSATATIVT